MRANKKASARSKTKNNGMKKTLTKTQPAGVSHTQKEEIKEMLKKIEEAGSQTKHFSDMTKEEKQQYTTRLRQLSAGPKLAQLQIRMLDQMIHHMKQKRANAGSAIEDAHAEIARIDEKMKTIHKKYHPVKKKFNDRTTERRRLNTQISDCEDKMAGILALSKQRIRKVNKSLSDFQSRAASYELQRNKGFSASQSHRLAGKKKTNANANTLTNTPINNATLTSTRRR